MSALVLSVPTWRLKHRRKYLFADTDIGSILHQQLNYSHMTLPGGKQDWSLTRLWRIDTIGTLDSGVISDPLTNSGKIPQV